MLKQPKHSEWIKSITQSKQDLLSGINCERDENYILQTYQPFMINKQLCKHIEYLFLLNTVNKKGFDKKLHYHFLLHSLPLKTG